MSMKLLVEPGIRVFVSYRNESRDMGWVQGTLVPRLEEFGFEVFTDQNVRAGESFFADIPAAIQGSGYFIAVCTPAYRKRSEEIGSWVACELATLNEVRRSQAQQGGKPRVIPLVRVGYSFKSSVPQAISDVKIVNLTDEETDAGYAELRESLYQSVDFAHAVLLYLRVLRGRVQRVELPGPNAVGNHRATLDDIYVKLNLQRFQSDSIEGEEPLGEAIECLRKLPATEGKRALLLGELGSGKSTVLKRLCLSYIQDAVTGGGRESFENRLFRGRKLTLPIFIHALVLERESGSVRGADLLRSCVSIAIGEQLGSSVLGNRMGEEICRKCKIVLIVDGLGEVGDVASATQMLGNLGSAVNEIGGTSLIVACREQSLSGDVITGDGFETLKLRGLDSEQVHEFIERRLKFEGGQTNETRVADYFSEFDNAREQHGWFEEIVRTPLFLSLALGIVVYSGADFPQRRGEFYRRSLDVVLGRVDGAPNKNETAKWVRFLASLAYRMHKKGESNVNRFSVQDSLMSDRVETPDGTEEPDENTVNELLRTGLIRASGEDQLRFSHAGFKEYLVFLHIERSVRGGSHDTLSKLCGLLESEPGWWDEVAFFLADVPECWEVLVPEVLDSWVLLERWKMARIKKLCDRGGRPDKAFDTVLGVVERSIGRGHDDDRAPSEEHTMFLVELLASFSAQYGDEPKGQEIREDRVGDLIRDKAGGPQNHLFDRWRWCLTVAARGDGVLVVHAKDRWSQDVAERRERELKEADRKPFRVAYDEVVKNSRKVVWQRRSEAELVIGHGDAPWARNEVKILIQFLLEKDVKVVARGVPRVRRPTDMPEGVAWIQSEEKVGPEDAVPFELGGGLGEKIEMFIVPEGELVLGPNGGGKEVRTRVSRYWLARYPVTNSQYRCFLKSRDDLERMDEGAVPRESMVNVTWQQAQEFCDWLTEEFKLTELKRFGDDWRFTLPTEAQWMRAFDVRTDPRGHEPADKPKTVFARTCRTEPGGEQEAGPERNKHKDLLGHVWEWCWDLWSEQCAGVFPELLDGGDCPIDPVANFGNEDFRVQRGGSWRHGARWLERGGRLCRHVEHSSDVLGFRVALSVGTAAKTAAEW